MTRIKLPYISEYRDRHGKLRRYFRRRGGRSIALPGLPGSIEFMAAYQAALAVVSPPPPSPKHVIAGSLAAIASAYLRSADFANLSPSSQRSYRVALKPILAAHGHRLVRDLPKEAARHVIEEIGATRPGMANLTRSVLSKVIAYAIETGIRPDNPFAGLKSTGSAPITHGRMRRLPSSSAVGLSARASGLRSPCCCTPGSGAATS
jgi:hypothetical protein